MTTIVTMDVILSGITATNSFGGERKCPFDGVELHDIRCDVTQE